MSNSWKVGLCALFLVLCFMSTKLFWLAFGIGIGYCVVKFDLFK